MKMRFPLAIPVLLFAALLGPVWAAPAEPADANAGISVNQTGVLAYPPLMLYSAIYSGEVHAVISVDAEGKLTDSLAVSYTNQAFADAAMMALKRWTYEPARVHGVASAARADVLFSFRDKGVIVQTLPGALERRMYNTSFDERYVYSPCKLRDLDRIPTPLHVVQPELPKGSSLPHGTKRVVTVEFYIDEQGRVRMPAIERTDAGDAFAAAAVTAVEQWKFEPPLRKGQPVLVLVRQDFAFVPKS